MIIFMSVRKRVQIKRLKGKSSIDLLFEKGKVIRSKRLLLLSIKKPNKSIYHSGVSVPKKLFKKAVDRNRIKRQMRVAIAKLDESRLFEGYGMLTYRSNEKPSFKVLKEEIDTMFVSLKKD